MKKFQPYNKITALFILAAFVLMPIAQEAYAAKSEAIVITVRMDTAPPAITIISPLINSTVEASRPLIKAEYSDGDGVGIDITSVRLLLNGQDITASSVVTSTSVSYTPSQDLPDGDYIVEVSVRDLKENPASASWSFRIYTGQLIGPEGGVVLSADGKIKLVIPPGALDEPTRIMVRAAKSGSFTEDELPENGTLAIAGEFLPADLKFNKDIEVIFFLDDPKVPGTELSLYLYHRTEGVFRPEYKVSAVQIDGVTLSFLVRHFSQYGAIEISQGAPFGSGVNIPAPDMFTGAFGHPISISVPPGRKGIQPNLTLQYRSSNSNSWCGFGWGLNPGYIVRSTKLGPPKYNDEEDAFIFITDAGATDLVHLTGNLYQAKIESSFARFYKESDDSWRVVNKDGTVLKFGTSSESKEASEYGTYAWYLTKFTDTNGNYIRLAYTNSEGKSYPRLIEYTGNDVGISPRNSVEFTLESRGDVFSSYVSGSKITTAKRLKRIQTRCNGDAALRYEFEYDTSPDTKRSLLKRVKTYTEDDKEFPTQEFTYQKAR